MPGVNCSSVGGLVCQWAYRSAGGLVSWSAPPRAAGSGAACTLAAGRITGGAVSWGWPSTWCPVVWMPWSSPRRWNCVAPRSRGGRHRSALVRWGFPPGSCATPSKRPERGGRVSGRGIQLAPCSWLRGGLLVKARPRGLGLPSPSLCRGGAATLVVAGADVSGGGGAAGLVVLGGDLVGGGRARAPGVGLRRWAGCGGGAAVLVVDDDDLVCLGWRVAGGAVAPWLVVAGGGPTKNASGLEGAELRGRFGGGGGARVSGAPRPTPSS